MNFLEAYGTERAEAGLADFLARVRGHDAETGTERQRALLSAEVGTLRRRIERAEAELDRERTELAEETEGFRRATRRAVALSERVSAADDAAPDEDRAELAALIADLEASGQALSEAQRDVARAGQWLSDVSAAADELAGKLAGPAPEDAAATGRLGGLVRSVSELSAMLDAMILVAEADRDSGGAARAAPDPLAKPAPDAGELAARLAAIRVFAGPTDNKDQA